MRKAVALFLAFCMCFQVLNISVFAQESLIQEGLTSEDLMPEDLEEIELEELESAEQNASQIEFEHQAQFEYPTPYAETLPRAEARYSSIRIEWVTESEKTYDILRSETSNGQFTAIAQNLASTTTQYIDNVGTGKKYWYKIKENGAGETEAFADNLATGLTALKTNAQFSKTYVGEDKIFNGTRIINYTDELDKIASLNKGSFLVKLKSYELTENPAKTTYLSAKAASASTEANASRVAFLTEVNSGNRYFRDELTTGMVARFATINGEWQQHIFTSDTFPVSIPGETQNIKTSSNGASTGGWNNASLGNFFTRGTGLNQLTVGGELVNGSIEKPFKGEIEYIIITDEVLSQAEMNAITSAGTLGAMLGNELNSTWVITGGETAQGSYENIGGARNYAGHFEERIRWEVSGSLEGRHRYVINTAKKGLSVSDVVSNFEALVSDYNPKAVAVMVGKEDYLKGEAGIENFKQNIQSLIETAKSSATVKFVVIQTPTPSKTQATNATIQSYINAIYEVADGVENVFIVDHYAQFTQGLIESGIKEDDSVNEVGHLNIARQLMKAVTGSDAFSNVTVFSQVIDEEASNAVYLNDYPSVNVSGNTLTFEAENAISYRLEVSNTIIESNFEATSEPVKIENLPQTDDFELVVKTEQGILRPVVGMNTVDEINLSIEQINDILNREQPAKWLFLGDSITHGASHTLGYDSVPQLFEKFLRDEQGRLDDVVINTAISGATTADQVNPIYKPYRFDAYKDADVVFIMYGMNDCVTSATPVATFKANLKTIVNDIKAQDAIPVLRTPNPAIPRNTALVDYMEAIRQVAAEENVLLVDHFALWNKQLETRPYLLNQGGFWIKNGDGTQLHPGPQGQLVLFQEIIKTLKPFNAETSDLTKLTYKIADVAKESSNITPSIKASNSQFVVDLKQLDSEYASGSLSSVTAKISGGNITPYSITTLASNEKITFTGLAPETDYIVEVNATVKEAAKEVTFKTQTLQIEDGYNENISISLSNSNVDTPSVIGTVVGEFSATEITNAVFELVDGAGSTDNAKFKIEGNVLKTTEKLKEFDAYFIRVKASGNGGLNYNIFMITTEGIGIKPIFADYEVSLAGQGKALSQQIVDKTKTLEEAIIIAQFRQSNPSAVETVFGISNSQTDKNGFHIYVQNGSILGVQLEQNNSTVLTRTFSGVAIKEFNTIAFVADKEAKQYRFYCNGEMIGTIDFSTYGYISGISGLNSANIGKYSRPSGANNYLFNGYINYVKLYEGRPFTDEEIIAITAETKKIATGGNEDDRNLFYYGDASGSQHFRIPSLYTTSRGVVVGAIDARFGGTYDSANNLDTTVRISKDGGKVWQDATLPLNFVDYENKPTGRQQFPASYIDPCLVEDEINGRLFMQLTTFAWGGGIFNGTGRQLQTGSGFISVNGERKWKLQKQGESAFNYYVEAVGFDDEQAKTRTIFKLDGTPTQYKLNSNYEVIDGNTLLTVKQRSADNTYVTPEKLVPMNVMYQDSIFQVFNTTYTFLTHSDDDGETWSDPINLNGMIRDESLYFLGVGPGRGIQIKGGQYNGRLLLPLYEHISGAERAYVIYSDDFGATWKRSQVTPVDSVAGKMSEAAPVQMPDGSIRLYARSTKDKAAYTTSFDGGQTWVSTAVLDPGFPDTTGNGCQMTIIRYSKLIDGKNALISASPAGVTSRSNGTVRIGLINSKANPKPGEDRFDVDWKYTFEVTKPGESYAYSCLTELPNGDIALIYEGADSTRIPYRVFTIPQLKNETSDNNGSLKLNSIEKIEGENEGETLKVKLEFNQKVFTESPTILTFAYKLSEEDEQYTELSMECIGSSEDGKELYYTVNLPVSLENVKYRISFNASSSNKIYGAAGGEYVRPDENKDLITNENIVNIIDKSKLEAAIDIAINLEDYLYTTESFAGIVPALANAQTVANNESATQKEVDDATTALRAAINNLALNPIEEDGEFSITISPSVQNGTVTADKTSAKPYEIVTLTTQPVQGYALKEGSLKYNSSVVSGNKFIMPSANVTITASFMPLITGIAQIDNTKPRQGHTLTVSLVDHNVTNISGLTYQWYRVDTISGAETAIAGATKVSYKTTEADADKKIKVKVAAAELSGVLESATTDIVKGEYYELPLTGLTATAGNIQAGYENEGPAHLAIDGSNSTLWHTSWTGAAATRPDHWLTVDVSKSPEAIDGKILVKGYRYLGRGSGTNGNITKYEIHASEDNGTTYKKVADGTWADNNLWKTVVFDNAVWATHVKLVSLESNSNSTAGYIFSAAVEVRVLATDIPEKYSITIGASPNGTVTADKTMAEQGEIVTITATPNAGYALSNIKVNGNIISGNIFTMPDKDVIIIAEFTAIANKHTVTFVDYDGAVLKVEEVQDGGNATPPQNPERAGYTFIGWNGSYENITSNITIKAKYTKNNTNAATLRIENATGNAGDEVTVKVFVEDNPGFSGMRFKINFNKQLLTPVSYEKLGLFNIGETLSNMNEEGVDLNTLDFVSFVWASSTDLDTNGQVLSVKFKINNEASEGDIPLTISYDEDDISDQEGNNVGLDCYNGKVIVTKYEEIMYGDVNSDKVVNTKDVIRVLQHLANYNNFQLTGYELKAANVNADDKIDSNDIVRLLQYLAGWNVQLGK